MQLELGATVCFAIVVCLNHLASDNWIYIFQLVASGYASLMLLKEKQIMEKGRDTFTSKVNSMISIIGYFLFFVASFLSGHYIKGKLYIGATFFLTLSVMLKILNYITAKNRSGKKKNISKNPNKCLILACITAVNYCLFISAGCESLALENDYAALLSVAKVCNWLGVLCHGGWLYFVYIQQSKTQEVEVSRKQYSDAAFREQEDNTVMGGDE